MPQVSYFDLDFFFPPASVTHVSFSLRHHFISCLVQTTDDPESCGEKDGGPDVWQPRRLPVYISALAAAYF